MRVGDKAAGVDHHNLAVDVAGVVLHSVAGGMQLTNQVLRIHEILKAPKGDYVNLVALHIVHGFSRLRREILQIIPNLTNNIIFLDMVDLNAKLTSVHYINFTFSISPVCSLR